MKHLFHNVRARLTLWYVISLSVILILYAGLSGMLLIVNLRNTMDNQLEEDFEVLESMVKINRYGQLVLDIDDESFLYDHWTQLWSDNGNLLVESPLFKKQQIPGMNRPDRHCKGFKYNSFVLPDHLHVRMMSGILNVDGHTCFFRLLRSEELLRNETGMFLLWLLIAMPVALILAGGGGYFMAGKLLSPVHRMTDKVSRIDDTNLQERLPVVNPDDELGYLAQTFNELLQRIQLAFERLKQFTADAAHELRTPLTAIRSIGEVGLQKPKKEKNYREIIGSMLEENDRLTHLIDSLLFLTHVDVKQYAVSIEKTDIPSFILNVIDIMMPLAEDKQQRIFFHPEQDISIMSDPVLLRQALINLLDNAIKYSPDHSEIKVKAYVRENTLYIEVSDQGPGIPETYREKIFERFYRLEKSHARTKGGSGLGLSIARQAIEILGGKIKVYNNEEGGSTFTLLFNYIKS